CLLAGRVRFRGGDHCGCVPLNGGCLDGLPAVALSTSTRGKAMKYLAGGAALAALLVFCAAPPSAAQTKPPPASVPAIAPAGPYQLAPQAAPQPPTAAPAAIAASNTPRPKRHVRQARRDMRVRQSTRGMRSYRERALTSPEDSMADELNVRQLTGRSARPYYGLHDREDYDYDRRASSPDDYGAADELNARQLRGGWYGGSASYPYASHAPPSPYMTAYPA